MVRRTSIETFKKIIENGLLSKRRLQVYTVLKEIGPATGSEVSIEVRKRFNIDGTSESIRNRLTELRNSGCVEEVGERIDKNSSVIVWQTNDNLPIKINKAPRQKCLMCLGTGYLEDIENDIR